MEGTHGSSRICSRERPFLESIGGKTLGPVKFQCSPVGECQGIDLEMGVSRGETRKWDNI